MTPDWLTLSGEFVSIWSIRVAVWSVILVCLVIICSRECVKQNSKYDLVRWGISLLIIFVGLCQKISLSLGCKFILMSPNRQHSWDSKTLVSLNVRPRQLLVKQYSVFHQSQAGCYSYSNKWRHCYLQIRDQAGNPTAQ